LREALLDEITEQLDDFFASLLRNLEPRADLARVEGAWRARAKGREHVVDAKLGHRAYTDQVARRSA
jgi:hypothetical protein